jgi:anaerobic magnesium-protoporphyrin IX monomethyl ester cyclase
MHITFIHPPFDDPTIPYHSLAYLHGHLTHSGFTDVSVRDLNVEFFNYCLEERVSNELGDEVERRLGRLRSKTGLTFGEQEEFYGLWSVPTSDHATTARAAEAMRRNDTFTSYATYLECVKPLEAHYRRLDALCYPAYLRNFKLKNHGRYSIYHLDDLFNEDLGHKICFPIDKFFFDRCLADRGLLSADCIGISIVYDHQMLPALHLTRLIKKHWPEKLVLIGGTAVSQCFKYLRDKSLLKRFFAVCDGIVVGEGETAMCEIAAAGGDLSQQRRIPNLITYDAKRDALNVPATIHYEHVATLGRPIYEYPWDLYLAPSRAINYSPTRGCYWNRCTFCDYGLNTNKPTSPWRERPVDVVVEDLTQIQQRERIEYVYFAVDVMAPGYLERLSDALDEAHLDLRWSAEIRMERIFSEERCRKMARSGCVCVSFGMESGNQRVLDLIDKGTKVQYMGETMKHFAEAGIAVQLMGFSHFPTETAAERRDTAAFVESHKEHWSAGGIGKFVLTGTALVAKNPEKFGLTLVEMQGADIARALGYQMNAAGEREMLSAEEGDDSFDDTGGIFPPMRGRPWAGSIDSLHTMIFYARCGREVFKHHDARHAAHAALERGAPDWLDGPVAVDGRLAASEFPIGAIFSSRRALVDYLKSLRQAAREPTYQQFLRWQDTRAPLARDDTPSYWVIRDEKCFRIPGAVHTLLQEALATQRPLSAVLEGFAPTSRQRLLEELRLLARKGYLRPLTDVGFGLAGSMAPQR